MEQIWAASVSFLGLVGKPKGAPKPIWWPDSDLRHTRMLFSLFGLKGNRKENRHVGSFLENPKKHAFVPRIGSQVEARRRLMSSEVGMVSYR